MAATVCLFAGASTAGAQQSTGATMPLSNPPPIVSDGIDTGMTQPPTAGSWLTAGQHGPGTGHLPAVRENIELVSKLEMSTPPALRTPETADDPVLPDQIADLAVYKNYAYLNSWSEPTCRRGGIFVVDISNPRSPQQVGFLPAAPNTRHGEGAHVITVGSMDVLAVNNEPLPPPCDQTATSAGGIDLWDVTNPRSPRLLALGVGDRSDPGEPQGGIGMVHHAHSVFLWKNDAGSAFAVMTDNDEFGTFDVDIMEITNPAAPRMFAEHNLTARFDIEDQSAFGNVMYHHDVVVKKIDGTWTMLVSYWDAGYVKLDVDDPRNPRYLGDTSFDAPDPLAIDPRTEPPEGWDPPEGNAHQAEFSHDNRYILAADEDFDTHRFVTMIGGEEAAFSVGVPVAADGTTRFDLLPAPEEPLAGDTRFIGDGCVATAVPAPQAGETVAVAERGTCDFDVKAANASAAGYEAILIFNNVLGPQPRCDEGVGNFGMIFDDPNADIMALLIPRAIGFRIIGAYDPDTYRCVRDDPTSTPTPAPNRAGVPVSFAFMFDGWGYTHLYDNGTGKLRQVDSYAIPEGLDERYWQGFGDLTVHEFAADASENVAYSSYYAGGMRVFTFGPDGLNETGRFIDRGGNNFWGVEQFTIGNQRYFAGSDRDFGLYIFRYTGPGAAQRPVCEDQHVNVPFQTPVTLSLRCSDANGNPLTLAIASGPSRGTLGGIDQGADTVTYRPNDGHHGPDSFTFTANDGTMTSDPATVRITVGPNPRGCQNLIEGTRAGDVIAGTEISDRIRAGRGDDVVDARGGEDCLSGQQGDEVMDAATGNDVASGGPGRDKLLGGAGADRLSGSAGMDRLFGGGGNDRLSGGAKRDYLTAGRRNDRLIGGPGRDSLVGDRGNDRMSGGRGNDILRGNQGSDRISGGGGRDLVVAARGRDRVNVADGRIDRVSCGSGRDRATADRFDRLTNCERVTRR